MMTGWCYELLPLMVTRVKRNATARRRAITTLSRWSKIGYRFTFILGVG